MAPSSTRMRSPRRRFERPEDLRAVLSVSTRGEAVTEEGVDVLAHGGLRILRYAHIKIFLYHATRLPGRLPAPLRFVNLVGSQWRRPARDLHRPLGDGPSKDGIRIIHREIGTYGSGTRGFSRLHPPTGRLRPDDGRDPLSPARSSEAAAELRVAGLRPRPVLPGADEIPALLARDARRRAALGAGRPFGADQARPNSRWSAPSSACTEPPTSGRAESGGETEATFPAVQHWLGWRRGTAHGRAGRQRLEQRGIRLHGSRHPRLRA